MNALAIVNNYQKITNRTCHRRDPGAGKFSLVKVRERQIARTPISFDLLQSKTNDNVWRMGLHGFVLISEDF